MKIKEFILAPSKSQDTTSCGTTSSAIKGQPTQDIVPEIIEGIILEQADHSAIAEGVSQIFRRQKGKKPIKGFRCTSGPRKGRIVAKPSTCFQKTDPVKSAKIRKKRQQKARGRSKEIGRRTDQEDKGYPTKIRWSKNRRPTIAEIKNNQTKKIDYI
jgi:hypothetical protein